VNTRFDDVHWSLETPVDGSNGPYALNTMPFVGDCAFERVAESVIVPPTVCAVAEVAFDAVVESDVQFVIWTDSGATKSFSSSVNVFDERLFR
jgi:hypothetical protein